MLVAAMLRVRWMIIRSLGSSEQGSYVLKVNLKFDVKTVKSNPRHEAYCLILKLLYSHTKS